MFLDYIFPLNLQNCAQAGMIPNQTFLIPAAPVDFHLLLPKPAALLSMMENQEFPTG